MLNFLRWGTFKFFKVLESPDNYSKSIDNFIGENLFYRETRTGYLGFFCFFLLITVFMWSLTDSSHG